MQFKQVQFGTVVCKCLFFRISPTVAISIIFFCGDFNFFFTFRYFFLREKFYICYRKIIILYIYKIILRETKNVTKNEIRSGIPQRQ
jgi:hypothetical protein